MKKKEKKRSGSYGAVTVFLTLILVPCIIFTCAFGDVSRVQLSRSQATAASDLALYSLMANYDESLKEWYGLVASCQDVDSFYDTSAKYFKGMMDANGVDGVAGQTLVSFINAARSGDITDFLQVDGLDSVKIVAVDGGAMGSNPALVEKGIVEFMKYRGPVVIVSEIIDRFQSLNLSGDLNGLTQANENEPIVEAKQEYAEAEGKMMEDFLHSYLAILYYMNYRSTNGVPIFTNYQNLYPDLLSKIRDDMANVTDVITKYYAATDGIQDIKGSFPYYQMPDADAVSDDMKSVMFYLDGVRMIYTLTGTENSWVGKNSSIGADYDKENDNYSFSYAAMEKLTQNVDSHIQNIETAAQNIVNACNGINYVSGTTNPAVYCMRIQNSIKTSDLNTIKNSGKALMQTAAKLYLAQCWDLPYPDPLHPDPLHDKDWRKEVPELINKIERINRNYLTYTSPTTDYERILNSYASISATTYNYVTQMLYPMHSELLNSNSVTLDNVLKEIRDQLGTLQKHLIRQIENIDKIINGGSVEFPTGSGKYYPVPSLNQLSQKIEEMSRQRDNWGNTAKSRDSQYANEEVAEYENPTEKGEQWVKAIADLGPDAVEELRTRLLNIRSDLVTLREVISNFKYGDKMVYSLTPTDAVAAARTVVPTTVDPSAGAYISLSLSDNSSAAQGYHSRLLTGGDNYTPPSLVSGKTGNEPDLNEAPPELYYTMREMLPIDEEALEDKINKKEEQEEQNKKNEEEAKKKEDGAKDADGAYLGDLGKNPKETSGSHKFDIGTAVTGLIGTVNTLISGNFDEFRDQMYVIAYIMEMFSWSSYSNEGQYKLAAKESGKDDLPTLSHYDETKHGFVKDGKDYTEIWKNEELTFTNNKSLTNQMIDSKHNLSNLAEVEYILYGKSDIKENLKSAYGQIFTVREALNLISGFQYYWNDTTVVTIATAIMAATAGLIPEVVTKVVLIGLMATLESVNDLNRLKAGTPVAIYKNKDQWCLALNEDMLKNLASTGSVQKTDPNGFYYSDYMLLFLMIACQDGAFYQDILLRVGDLVEGNVGLMGGGGFDLETAQCYFRLTGDIHVKPLMLELPIVTNYKGADASKLTKSTGWCTYHLDVIRGYS